MSNQREAWLEQFSERKNSQKKLLMAILLFVLVVCAFSLKRQGILDPESMFIFLETHRILAPLLFIILFIFISPTLVPTLPLNLGAGFLWGPVWGSVISIIGATAGAVFSFLISRYIASAYCNRKFQNPAWIWLQRKIEEKGWKAVAFTRINPIFSTGPVNYFFGITPIPFFTYLWSTFVFFTPPSVMFASIGSCFGRDALTGGAQDLIQNIVLVSAIVTFLFVSMLIFKKWLKKDF
ncbi:MAG: TVP38/TMEM64 family protein [Spirochaetales bacterium]|nr:TVP38/TMEM64 family protein [Spirochaetales bacterium]